MKEEEEEEEEAFSEVNLNRIKPQQETPNYDKNYASEKRTIDSGKRNE